MLSEQKVPGSKPRVSTVEITSVSIIPVTEMENFNLCSLLSDRLKSFPSSVKAPTDKVDRFCQWVGEAGGAGLIVLDLCRVTSVVYCKSNIRIQKKDIEPEMCEPTALTTQLSFQII